MIWAADNSEASEFHLDMICNPTGRLFEVNPQGIEITGHAVRLRADARIND